MHLERRNPTPEGERLSTVVPAEVHPEREDEKPTNGRDRLPLFVALITLLVAYLRFGYAFGGGDHDELLPSVLHLLDGSLFTQDWLVQTVTSGINVRTYFLWLTTLPSLLLPPWLIFFLLWVAVFVGVAYGVYALAMELVRDRLAAAASVFVSLVVTVRWTLGDNAVVYDLLAPEGVAWALAVPAITLFLQRRWAWAGLLLGLATWFHLLAGLQTALVLGAIGLVRAAATADLEARVFRADLEDLARFGGSFVLAALPILIPVALQQFTAGSELGDAVPSLYIHAAFRNPHHHLFFAFEPGRHLRFWPLVGLGVAAGVVLARRGELWHGRKLAAGGVVIVVLCMIAVVFVEIVPIGFVAKLQFFKLTVLVVLVASILLSAAIVRTLPPALRRPVGVLLRYQRAGLAAMIVLTGLVGVLAVWGISRPGAMLHPLRHQMSPLGEVEAWVRTQTAEDALFAIPPSVSTFRSFSRRAVVADFTGFVFTDTAMQTWFRRLMDIAPIPLPATGVGIKPKLDAAYHGLGPADWQQLHSGYGVDYVVVRRDERSLPFDVVFTNEEWAVYRLTDLSL